MKKLKICGGRPLRGEIQVSGAKNASLPILCASLLTNDTLYLKNIPRLQDVAIMLQLLTQIGVNVSQEETAVKLTSAHIDNPVAPYELVKMMRASILVLGPLLARFGYARVSLPGGCNIGARPVDQHIKGLQAMGAEIEIAHGFIEAKVVGRLRGAHIVTDMTTVTGTENLLMAAVLADGETIIENAACEPEVTDLANLLLAMGAQIKGLGSTRLIIQGVEKLHGATHHVIPDRIEAGTFLCAAAATQGNITLTHIIPEQLHAIIMKLREMGAIINVGQDSVNLAMHQRLRAVHLQTATYPDFPTDMQAQFMALNAIAEGNSTIVETIFENRFMHVQELNRLGANIKVEGNIAYVNGVNQLSGAAVMATDLRASASLIIAGLVADGETLIDRIYHLDRGYDKIEHKLSRLGANICRTSTIVTTQPANDSQAPVSIKQVLQVV